MLVMKERIKVRIAIPTHRRYHYIELLAASLERSVRLCTQRYPNVAFEVFIVASRLTDLTRLQESASHILGESSNPKPLKLDVVNCFACSDVIQRNLAVSSETDADYIAFLDDDLVVDAMWAQRVALHVMDGSEIVQGNPTGCANPEHILSRMESYSYRDMLNRYLEGRGNYTTSKLVDPRNLLVKREIATKFLFDRNFNLGGSGFDLGQRLSGQGYRTFYDQEMRIYHFNRESLLGLLMQKVMHGRGRRKLVLKYPQLKRNYASPTYYLKRHYIDVYRKHGLTLMAFYLFFSNSAFWLGYFIEGASGAQRYFWT